MPVRRVSSNLGVKAYDGVMCVVVGGGGEAATMVVVADNDEVRLRVDDGRSRKETL